ncbi:hypothetical protein J6590_039050 [Homalodisca vitripennis]|nr:hypothetical protein J6590_039050 [Homalodisca vitripennis]
MQVTTPPAHAAGLYTRTIIVEQQGRRLLPCVHATGSARHICRLYCATYYLTQRANVGNVIAIHRLRSRVLLAGTGMNASKHTIRGQTGSPPHLLTSQPT